MKIVITSASPNAAEPLVQKLLKKRLIACGNIWGGVQSMYWWNGEIQKDPEVLVLMETKSELAGVVVEEIATLHSYDVPKILVLEPSQVYQAYQLWLQEETR